MTYRIKTKSRRFPKGYWREREMVDIRKKYKGKMPPILKDVEEGTRVVMHIPETTHKRTAMINYRHKLARIEKVTQEGVWITPFKTTKGFIEPSKKQIFISQKKIEAGVIEPNFIPVPFYFSPTLVMKE